MPIFDLFSKRQKRLRGETPKVITFDSIPTPLRVRVVHIIQDAIGHPKFGNEQSSKAAYEFIHQILCREYGVFKLIDQFGDDNEEIVLNFLLQTTETEQVLDVIELCFKFIDEKIRGNSRYAYQTAIKISPDEAISELNQRFKEMGIGFSFSGGKVIRIDSSYIHSEVTEPTISLLWNRTFLGANEEYLKAHEHYKHGRNKECLLESCKALESTLKIICKEKGWSFKKTDTARKLIQTCFKNGLVPPFTQNQFTSLISIVESGVPTIRNKLGGHGQGQVPQKVDDEITRYALNLTGTNIIFLIEQSGLT